MLAIIFFIVCVNIICTFLYLLFEKEPKKKPVVEEKSEKPKHLEYSGIRYAKLLHVGFYKKDNTYETFSILNCHYQVKEDFIILILPNSTEDRMSSILDKDQFNNYISTSERKPDIVSYNRFIHNCNNSDILCIKVIEAYKEPYFVLGSEHDILVPGSLCKRSYIVWTTELEFSNSYETNDEKFRNRLTSK